MRIAIFSPENRPGPKAMARGAERLGIQVLWRPPRFRSGVHPLDVNAVITDSAKGENARVVAFYSNRRVPVWIMELPRLRTTANSGWRALTTVHGLYLNSLHYLSPHPGNTAVVRGVIAERESRYVLICAQAPNDAAHGMAPDDLERWSAETVYRAREYGLPVVYRPHPQTLAWFTRATDFGADAVSWPSKESLRDALRGAHAVVTYNSTSGLEAIDAGVPVVYTAPASDVCFSPYASTLDEPLRELSEPEREECLLRIAASHWTLEQLRSGVAARCIFRRAPWPEGRLVTMDETEERSRSEESLGFARGLEERRERRQALVAMATAELGG